MSMEPVDPAHPDTTAPAQMNGLRWPRFWRAAGWLGLLAICCVSLLPLPAGSLELPGSDKFMHLFAYFLLTFGHTQLGLPQPVLLRRAGAFLLVSILIEVLQGQTGYRSFEVRDMIANTVGIVFGLVIGTAMPTWLQRTEHRLLRLWRRLRPSSRQPDA